MEPPTPPPITIAIIGSGLGGLTLALALTTHNPSLQLTIFEQRPEFSEIGAGVGLGPNAIQALTLIDPALTEIYNKVKAPSLNTDPDKDHRWFDVYRDDGRFLTGLWAKEGFDHAGASRAAFLDGLVGALPESVKGRVRFGRKLVGVEEVDGGRLRVSFENGEVEVVDAVVGCDGVRSRCRVLLLGEEEKSAKAVYSGKYAYRKVVDMETAVAAVGEEIKDRVIYSRKGGHILTFPIMGGRGLNMVVFRDAEGREWTDKKWVVPSSREELLEDFREWGEKPRKLLELIDTPDKWALFDHLPAPTYAKGNFCLLGDAAHATTPHCGAGAGFAVEDAHLLSGLLTPDLVKSPSDIKVAFKAYDEIRRPRSQKLVKSSRAQGRKLDLQNDDGNEPNGEELKNGVKETMKWVWEVDLKAMLEEARSLMISYK